MEVCFQFIYLITLYKVSAGSVNQRVEEGLSLYASLCSESESVCVKTVTKRQQRKVWYYCLMICCSPAHPRPEVVHGEALPAGQRV